MRVVVSFAVALAVLAWVAVYPPGAGAVTARRAATRTTQTQTTQTGGGPGAGNGGGTLQVGCGG